MRPLQLEPGPLSILCLGAHADDIEIGCGGTLLKLLAERPGSTVRWIVLSGEGERADEAREGAGRFTAGAATLELGLHRFTDGLFPAELVALKGVFEALKAREQAPDLIFTHARDDRHQDHRTVSDLTWQTFRDHLILEYEVPKYDGDLGQPNLFVPLSETACHTKVEHLMELFPSQRHRQWFTATTFRALLRLRGIESASPEGYAEGFHLRKARLG